MLTFNLFAGNSDHNGERHRSGLLERKSNQLRDPIRYAFSFNKIDEYDEE